MNRVYLAAMFPTSSQNGRIRVLVVDDHRYVHTVISTLAEGVSDITVVGHASNGLEACHFCEADQPDVVLMDVVMPVMDGLDATRTIHAAYPNVKILVLSSFQDHESVQALLKHGAVGYITKSSLTAELIHLIRTTAAGKAVLAPEVMEKLVFASASTQHIYKFELTDRELEVLILLADGLQNQQIAGKLSISLSTVKYHQTNIYAKLGVQTRSEALVVAAKNNLI